MTATPTFSTLIQRLQALHCPFTLDLTELDLCTAASHPRLHLIHFLLSAIAPTLAPPLEPAAESPATIDALTASCVAVGVCDAVTAVRGVSDGSWAENGRVLFALLELAEARHLSNSAFDSHLSLLLAGCTSAASLLSTEVHLFPADVLLTNKQLSQQPTGRALVTHIAQQADELHSRIDSTAATTPPIASSCSASPSSSSTSALPALLSSVALLSAALPALSNFHAAHIPPHRTSDAATTAAALSTAPLSSLIFGLDSARSSISSHLQHAATLSALIDVSGVCEVCDVASGSDSASGNELLSRNAISSATFDIGRLSVALQC